MPSETQKAEKPRLHPRNKNREKYDLAAITNSVPELAEHIKNNKYGVESIDFSNPKAVKLLNKGLLSYYYGIKNWDFPDENLCPPIPGRADYIHHLADLLGEGNWGNIPTGKNINCLDIGIGASSIYPIIGVTEYQWNFIGSDIDNRSIESAREIIKANPSLKDKIKCRIQTDRAHFFKGILSKKDKIDLTVCNPPFHSSAEEALRGTRRKVQNLSKKKIKKPILNFSGVSEELIYKGGEYKFIHDMILESKEFSKTCYWFSTIVSKQSNLTGIFKTLEKLGASQTKIIPFGTGNKISRIIAWTFLNKHQQKEWRKARWPNSGIDRDMAEPEADYYHTSEGVKEYIKLAKGVDGSDLIDRLSKELPAKSSVLELGSGPGIDWRILDNNYKVTGSDSSPEFIKHLEKENPTGSFLLLDAATLETEERFDAIYSNKVMHHLKNKKLSKSIKRQHQILNEGGIICHSFWKGHGAEVFKGLFVNYHEEDALRAAFEPYFTILRLDTYKESEEDDSILLIGKKL